MAEFREVRKIVREIRKHPSNSAGKYYVDQNSCFWCTICVDTAPNNFAITPDDAEFGAYVFKEPENSDEEEKCCEALNACPHEAVHDDGE